MVSPSRCPKRNRRRWADMRDRAPALALIWLFVICSSSSLFLSAQERGPVSASPQQIQEAIGKLGDFDYPTRMAAGRTLRRAPGAQAVPALLQAVSEHADGF